MRLALEGQEMCASYSRYSKGIVRVVSVYMVSAGV